MTSTTTLNQQVTLKDYLNLQESAIYGRDKEVEELLGKGVHPDGLLSKPGAPFLAEHQKTGRNCPFVPPIYDSIERLKNFGKEAGYRRCITLLLNAKADPNFTDSCGNNLLLMACQHKVIEVAKQLLDAGADPKKEAKSGLSVLDNVKDKTMRTLLENSLLVKEKEILQARVSELENLNKSLENEREKEPSEDNTGGCIVS